MQQRKTKLIISLALVIAGSFGSTHSILAQRGGSGPKANTRILYHNGPVMHSRIYLIAASADVTDMRDDGSTFCTPGTSPLHGHAEYLSTGYVYGYIGAGARCPTSVGSHFPGQIAPNGSFNADTMANQMARLLNVIVTSPLGNDGPTGGWYDRNGLENSDKCVGNFARPISHRTPPRPICASVSGTT